MNLPGTYAIHRIDMELKILERRVRGLERLSLLQEDVNEATKEVTNELSKAVLSVIGEADEAPYMACAEALKRHHIEFDDLSTEQYQDVIADITDSILGAAYKRKAIQEKAP